MSQKKSYLTYTDQFCGAGGSSAGAHNFAKRMGGGLEGRMALNHWNLAIETHNSNFPDMDHDCTDVSACDPRRYPSTDILITSPECTNHSLANGKKKVKAQMDMFIKGELDPAAERSRATMWDVPRFAEYHQYRAIIVENVVDARAWVMWEAWLHAMHLLGYEHKCVYRNSMHHYPTPQSRDRMYIVFWKRGQKAPDLEFYPLAWCAKCDKNIHSIQSWKNPAKPYGKYRTQYLYCCPNCTKVVEPYYYAAFNCIDWTNIGTRIGDRKKALSPNTERRVVYGLNKFGVNESLQTVSTAPQMKMVLPFIIKVDRSCKDYSAFDPLHTIVGGGSHHGVITPFIFKGEHTLSENGYVRDVTEAMDTQTTRQSMGLITPFIVELNSSGKARSSLDFLSTILTSGSHHALVVENKGASMSKPITEPLGSQTTIPHHGLVSDDAWQSFITYYNGKPSANGINDAIGTLTASDRATLVNYQEPRLEDCYYRMLKPDEIKRGMAFADDYIILGNSRDKVKQCGNAVTPPVMEWLVERVVNSLM